MSHSVRTYNNSIPAVCFTLSGVKQIDFTSGAIGGYLTAIIKLTRKPGKNYLEIWFGYTIEIVSDDGDVVWEGIINDIPEDVSSTGTFDIGCIGNLWLLAAITGTWGPNYNTLTNLRTIITDGIAAAAPGITYDTVTFPSSAVSVIYTPDNVTSVRNHLDELIKYGTSTNLSLYWQVLNGRKFWVFTRPSPLTTYDYILHYAECASAKLGINASNFYTRVTVRWKDATITHLSPYNNTAMQTSYAMSFGNNDPAGTRLPYIREPEIIDITGHGNLTQAQADLVGQNMLNRYSNDGIRMTASKVIITDGQAVRDLASSQITGLSKIKPAKTVLLTDMPGSSGLLGPSSSGMFIGQVHFTETYENGTTTTVELSAEDVINPANLLAALAAQLPKEQA